MVLRSGKDFHAAGSDELRAILEAEPGTYAEEDIILAREAMAAHNKRVTGKWIKALGLKIVVTLAIIAVLLAIYYFP